MAEDAPPLSEAEDAGGRGAQPAARPKVVHAAVVKQGEDELERPTVSLFWSGLAAGLAIIASVWAQAALHQRLPPTRRGGTLVAGLGYSLGFIIVILGRMQLFTEHTMVAVLPLARKPNGRNFRAGGAALVGAARRQSRRRGARLGRLSFTPAFGRRSCRRDARPVGASCSRGAQRAAASGDPRRIPDRFGGLDPLGRRRFGLLDRPLLSYAIALGGFTHVVAGAAEAFLLLGRQSEPPG